MLHKGFGKDVTHILFGIASQLVALSILGGVLVLVAVWRGGLGAEWVSRFGLILELLGLLVLFLEYLGVAQFGQSPLRRWIRSFTGTGNGEPPYSPWPRQMVIILGVTALIMGLALQLLGSFR